MPNEKLTIDHEALYGPLADEPVNRRLREGSYLITALCKADKEQLDRIEAKLDQLLSRQ